SAGPHPGTRPCPEHSDPSSAFSPRPPGLDPLSSGFSSSTDQAESSPADRSKPPAPETEADPDKGQWAQPENLIDHSESLGPPAEGSSLAATMPRGSRAQAPGVPHSRLQPLYELVGLETGYRIVLASWFFYFSVLQG